MGPWIVHSRQPKNWQTDPDYAAQVWARIDQLLTSDNSYMEIARIVGVANRTVERRARKNR